MKKSMKLFSAIAFMIALTFSACTKDECEDVVCENDGVCVEGTCDCPSGFEGTTCETLSRAKFLGMANYTFTESCDSNGVDVGSYVNTFQFAADPTNETKVLIRNLGAWPCTAGNYDVDASIDGGSLIISNQTACGYVFEGTGSLNADSKIVINYTTTLPNGDVYTCNAIQQ